MTHIDSRTRDIWAAISADPHASIAELKRRLGLSSTSVVQRHLRRLEALGYIEQDPYVARGRRVVVPLWER